MNPRVKAIYIVGDDGEDEGKIQRPLCPLCKVGITEWQGRKEWQCTRCFHFFEIGESEGQLKDRNSKMPIILQPHNASKRRQQDYPKGANINHESEYSPVTNEWTDLD